jgi:hypothetical protein
LELLVFEGPGSFEDRDDVNEVKDICFVEVFVDNELTTRSMSLKQNCGLV